MAKKYITIAEDDGVVRIDKFMAKTFHEFSRAAITKLFDLNLIKFNGRSLKPGERVRPGSKIEYDLGPLQAKPEVIPLPVIYEDDNVIVIDKPTGIISHARGKFWQEASVASFIRDRISGMEGERGGIVHRLDRATSGVMICARNEESLKFLQKQFSTRKVIKTYIALIDGIMPTEEGVIDMPIERNPKKPQTFRVGEGGKNALTRYKTIRKSSKYSLLEIHPETGRTHQLRVHLSHLNHPIVGDELYGGSSADRLMLHAASIEIILPDHTKDIFTSPLPKEFNDFI